VQQIERDCFSVAKRISFKSISGFTRSSIYIYDISSLRVNICLLSVELSSGHTPLTPRILRFLLDFLIICRPLQSAKMAVFRTFSV